MRLMTAETIPQPHRRARQVYDCGNVKLRTLFETTSPELRILLKRSSLYLRGRFADEPASHFDVGIHAINYSRIARSDGFAIMIVATAIARSNAIVPMENMAISFLFYAAPRISSPRSL